MGQIGGLMFFFGLVSTGMYFLGRELTLLMWIDNWGETVGWVIRIGLMVLGAALWMMARRGNADHVE